MGYGSMTIMIILLFQCGDRLYQATVGILFHEFSMTKLIFFMTKFRLIPDIKLKNVSSSITSQGLDKSGHHNIFFIDKYFSHDFWQFSQIP